MGMRTGLETRRMALDKDELIDRIRSAYDIEPDYPWLPDEDYAVFRHPGNRKWFALFMELPARRLGIRSEKSVSVVNVKCDPIDVRALHELDGIYHAYHMNKTHWISICLEEAPEALVCDLIEASFRLTA